MLRLLMQITLILLIVSVFVSAIQTILVKHNNRMFLGELASLQQQQDELDVIYGQLQLEYSHLRQASRLSEIAHQQLDMIIPHSEDIIIIKPNMN